jgi:hypothetical protein
MLYVAEDLRCVCCRVEVVVVVVQVGRVLAVKS